MALTSMTPHPELPTELWEEIFSYLDNRTLAALTYIRPFRDLAHRLLYSSIFLALPGSAIGQDKRIYLIHRTFMENPVLGEYVRRVELSSVFAPQQNERLQWFNMREECIGGYLGEDMTRILRGDPPLEHPDSEPVDDDGLTPPWPIYHCDSLYTMRGQWQKPGVTWHDITLIETVYIPGILQRIPNMRAIMFGQRHIFFTVDWNLFSHSMRAALVKAFQHKELEKLCISNTINVPSFVLLTTPAVEIQILSLSSIVQTESANRWVRLGRKGGNTYSRSLHRLEITNVASDQKPLLEVFANREVDNLYVSPTSAETFLVLNAVCTRRPWADSITNLTIDVVGLADKIKEGSWNASEQSMAHLESLTKLKTLQLHIRDWQLDDQQMNGYFWHNIQTRTEIWWKWAIKALNSALRTSAPILRDISLTVTCYGHHDEDFTTTNDLVWTALREVLMEHVERGVRRVRMCFPTPNRFGGGEFPLSLKENNISTVKKHLDGVQGLELCHHEDTKNCIDYEPF
ncbi:hypothetical protein FA15DRAFT_704801 [Coprinopsis marcescibilis]|uniref:F-box domain-containing protein n=1 Tax=Coprinopsis marcescibilis TaxID=230819 RepID=A0A5C3KU39_COPMA|nr:hypothetical protein FA15DRAFT_704801 [Coprinopsis marcescibilis]